MTDSIKVPAKGRTQMVAHRGLSGLERENTIPAFVAACNRSHFGVETDIHVTADGRYVVYHDDDTSRLCDRNMIIEESDFASLRALKIKESGSEQFSETLKMPTLEEYLGILSRYRKFAVIELKRRFSPEDIRKVIEICKACYSLDRIIFISFWFENLEDVRKFLPKQPVQFLTGEYQEGLAERLAAHGFDLDIGYWSLTKERVEELHAKGIFVNCWTCDDPAAAERLASWGVDFITSNILE
ncbi:MAG: hypothetical protein K2H43_05285 [Clostridia bacterium]|nr:hypothetical protein [Clostridia bacterium]